MSAKNMKTGQNLSAKNHSASRLERVLTTYLDSQHHKPARRRAPEDVHAQLILIIGSTLAAVFLIVTVDLIKQTKARKIQKKKTQKQEKVFLLEAMIGNTRQGFATYGFFQLFNFLISVFDNVEFSNLSLIHI